MSFRDFWKGQIQKTGKPLTFAMIRNADESGTSGVGHVLDGVVFPSGKVVVCWDPVAPSAGEIVNSVSMFDSFKAFCKIHIDQHPGNGTEVKFYDDN